MMGAKRGQPVFVDTGAWIALALESDPLHGRAKEAWTALRTLGVRLTTSVPVVLETVTFLERNTSRDVALRWKDEVRALPRTRILPCGLADLEASWAWFSRKDLHRLSAVDATSFVLMRKEKIRMAFAFDHHFASAGFTLVG